MAKDINQRFTISAGKAIAALNDTTKAVDKYNTSVGVSAGLQKDLNDKSRLLRTEFNLLKDQVEATVKLMAQNKDNVREFAKQTGFMTQQIGIATTGFTNLNTQIGGLATQFGRAGTSFGRLATNARNSSKALRDVAKDANDAAIQLNNVAGSSANLDAALNRDTIAVNANTASMRRMRTAVDNIVKSMQLKNTTVGNQVRVMREDHQQTGFNISQFIILAAAASLVHRAVGVFTRGIEESIESAQEYQLRIGEIQTVSLEMRNGILQSARATEVWSDNLLALSSNMGIPVLEQAEAVYQALSNQVVTAGNATQFMFDQMKLAIVSVSTLNQSVEVTSSVLKAYHLEAASANQVNATLFKGVEVGRFRLDELGSSFGRTNVLASQLGVSYQEVIGTLALLTRLGLQADVANTLLSNTFNGLIKPSKEMAVVLGQMGANSGEGAIKALGFANVFRKLAVEVSNGSGVLAETAEIFNDLRALTGASGLIQNLGDLESTINQVSNATDSYNAAFAVQMENLGVRGKIQLEKFKQYFLVGFGLPIQQGLVEFAESMGGAGRAVERVAQIIRVAVATYVTYRVAHNLLGTQIRAASAAMVNQTGVIAVLTAAERARAVALFHVAAAQAAVTLGLSLVIAAVAEFAFQSFAAAQNLEILLQEMRAATFEQASKNFTKLREGVDKELDGIIKKSDELRRAYLGDVAAIRILSNNLAESFDLEYNRIAKTLKDAFKVGLDDLTANLKLISAELDKAKKAAETAATRLEKLKDEESKRVFEKTLEGKSPLDQAKALEAESVRLHRQALDLKGKDEDAAAEKSLALSLEYAKKAEEILEKAREDAKKDVVKRVTVRDPVTGEISETTTDDATKTKEKFKDGIKGGIRITETEESVKNAKLIEIVGKNLLILEENRNARAAERRAAEEAFLERQIKKQKELEDLKKEKEASLEVFRDKVAEVDAFKGKKADPKQFEAAVNAALEAGKAAGLGVGDLNTILREAFSLRLVLTRQALVEETKEHLNAVEQQADAAKKTQALLLEDLKTKRTEFTTKVPEIVAGADDLVARLRAQPTTAIQKNGLPVEERNALIEKNNALQDERDLVLNRIEQLNNQLAKQKDNTEGAKAATDALITSLQQLEVIEAKLKNLASQSIVTAKGKRQSKKESSDTLLDFFSSEIPADSEKGVLLPRRAGQREAEGELEVTRALLEATLKLKALQDESDAAKKAIEDTKKAYDAELVIVNKTREALGIANEAAVTGDQKQIDLVKQLNIELEASKKKLEELAALYRQLLPEEKREQTEVPNAFGGIGSDTHLAAISPNERIMTSFATRQYDPILRAMNNSRPSSSTSNILNVGGISVSSQGGGGDQQAQQIAAELMRLNRRGLFSLRN